MPQLKRSLDRAYKEGEAVSVRTFEPATVANKRKMEIADELRKYFAEVDSARQAISEEEAEAVVMEAIKSVRPGYHPRQ